MGEEIAIHVLEPVGYAKYVPRQLSGAKQSRRISQRYPKVIPRGSLDSARNDGAFERWTFSRTLV